MNAAPRLIPIEKYLHRTYRPDRDYVDGVLVKRRLGRFDHSNFVGALVAYLFTREKQWNVRTLISLRIQTSETRIRVADVCLLSRDAPKEQIPTVPPVLCLEVLSPQDRWLEFERHVRDFLRMGVPAAWVFDPSGRSILEYTSSGRRRVTEETLALAGTAISIHLPELFADLA